jgi:hypothetical protein
MQLNRIDDPRDPLSKARRSELVRYARANGVKEIDPDMPALLMRDILRRRGLTRPPIPNRPLGAQVQNGLPAVGTQQNGVEADALADLARQYQQQRQPPLAPSTMGINELRAECKRLGIRLSRRDNMNSMREKIGAHGKDTVELGQ